MLCGGSLSVLQRRRDSRGSWPVGDKDKRRASSAQRPAPHGGGLWRHNGGRMTRLPHRMSIVARHAPGAILQPCTCSGPGAGEGPTRNRPTPRFCCSPQGRGRQAAPGYRAHASRISCCITRASTGARRRLTSKQHRFCVWSIPEYQSVQQPRGGYPGGKAQTLRADGSLAPLPPTPPLQRAEAARDTFQCRTNMASRMLKTTAPRSIGAETTTHLGKSATCCLTLREPCAVSSMRTLRPDTV